MAVHSTRSWVIQVSSRNLGACSTFPASRADSSHTELGRDGLHLHEMPPPAAEAWSTCKGHLRTPAAARQLLASETWPSPVSRHRRHGMHCQTSHWRRQTSHRRLGQPSGRGHRRWVTPCGGAAVPPPWRRLSAARWSRDASQSRWCGAGRPGMRSCRWCASGGRVTCRCWCGGGWGR